MFSPIMVVFLSGPDGFPLSSPNLSHQLYPPSQKFQLTWPSAFARPRCARQFESASSSSLVESPMTQRQTAIRRVKLTLTFLSCSSSFHETIVVIPSAPRVSVGSGRASTKSQVWSLLIRLHSRHTVLICRPIGVHTNNKHLALISCKPDIRFC